MDERKNNNHPWDDSVYGTGRTEPPKSHGGTVALLLILIIFLCGIITVLGVLNVRLFQKLNTRRESEQSISFATGAVLPAETTALPTESIDATLGEDTPTIDLQKCPQGVENVPTEGALSLQKIYSRNIDSVVSITSTGQGTTATGTGVILTEDGYIVTNCHVVENGISITAQLTDGRTLPAMLVGADSVSDLAVLHIDTTGLTPAQFENTNPNFENVTFSVTDGALTITPMPLTITAGSDSKAYNGTPLTITGTSGNWTAVTINGVKGYVNSAYVTTTKSDGGSKPICSIGETIVATAKQYMGAPYVYGGMSPSGFDCSGFVNYVYKLCGYSMSRVASSIYNNNGTYVEKANLQIGDLVFFASNSSSIGHVGIYIGNGQFIHSSSGAGCVVISDLSSSYYLKNYVGAKRIAG